MAEQPLGRRSALGELDEALRLARESTEYYRQLAQADAAAYLPDLAMALINLAARLGEAGEQQSALEMAARRLAITGGWLTLISLSTCPGLGRALNNLGILLGQAGHRAEAVPAPARPPRSAGNWPTLRRHPPPRPGHIADQPRQPARRGRRPRRSTAGRPRGREIRRELARAAARR